jgi:hypothetical protein
MRCAIAPRGSFGQDVTNSAELSQWSERLIRLGQGGISEQARMLINFYMLSGAERCFAQKRIYLGQILSVVRSFQMFRIGPV